MKTFKQFKEKFGHQMGFLIAAIMLTVVTVGLSIYFLTFLVSNLTSVLNVKTSQISTKQFDTQGFEKLNLGR